MEDNAGAVTIPKVTTGLVLPERVAVILVLPTAIPVTIPVEEMVAMLVSELAQLT
jgi:hypothetical protein